MVFSSTVFLFIYLPVVLGLYYLFFLPAQRMSQPLFRVLSNLILLTASLFFYAWGERFFVLIMIASILANYLVGLWIDGTRNQRSRKAIVALGVSINLGLLSTYKYANFLVDNLNWFLGLWGLQPVELAPIHLPIGISFFTFQAMSYVIDIYRGEAEVQKNPLYVALYISLFPQLIAGPILRYRDVAVQLIRRVVTTQDFAEGIRRFVIGLGKKVLIADTLAVTVDKIFLIPPDQLTTGLAWLGIVGFSLQVYYDFAAYSDMAIGLGRMLGFRFLENFRWPYISQSMREFWTRWHISLVTWFRDYVYFPLGGNRCSQIRTHFNLVTIFFLCGLWHGASWTYVIWGFSNGAFLVLERMGFEKVIARLWRPLRHLYLLSVVAWTMPFFRAPSLDHALVCIRAMAGFPKGLGTEHHARLYLNDELVLVLIVGILFSIPWIPWLASLREKYLAPRRNYLARFLEGSLDSAAVAALVLIFVASAMWLSSGTYNPFMYFRF